MTAEFIGKPLSLISKSEIRYTGLLVQIQPENATISLEKVKSMGTEGRKGDPSQEIPPSDNVYDFIVFRASDIKDLKIDEPAPQEQVQQTLPNDPAILNQPTNRSFLPPQQYPPHSPFGGPPMYPGFMPPPPQFNPYGQYNMPPGPFAQQPFVSNQSNQPGPQNVMQGQPAFGAPGQARSNSQNGLPVPVEQPVQKPVQQSAQKPQERIAEPAQKPSAPTPAAPQNQPKAAEPKPAVSIPAAAAPEAVPQTSKPTPNYASAAALPRSAMPAITQPTPQRAPAVAPSSSNDVSQLADNMQRLQTNGHVPSRGSSRGRGGRAPGNDNRAQAAPGNLPDFDFASSNAKFEERKTQDQDAASPIEESFYSKQSSFFDNISSEAKERTEGGGRAQGNRIDRVAERDKNMDTFGEDRSFRPRGRGRGRGRGLGRGRGRGAMSSAGPGA